MITINKKDDEDYQFQLKSKTGNTLLKSVSFNTKTEIFDVLNHLKENPHKNRFFERRTNYKGDFQFHLKNVEGKIIGSSASYSSEAGMENGIKNLTKSISELKLT